MRRQLATLVEAGVSEITLVIDSRGWLPEPTLITYGFIRSLPATINTHAQGFVPCSATILYLAGQSRSADRGARFLFHSSQALVTGMMDERQVLERAAASALVAVIALRNARWLVAGTLCGVARRPLKKLDPDPAALEHLLTQWRIEAETAGRPISRMIVVYEADRDGFWLARRLASSASAWRPPTC